jgi:hypothetical protein
MAKSARKLHLEETATGYPANENAIILEAVKQFRSAVCQNWPHIREVNELSEDGKVSFSFGATVNRAGKRPVVTGKLSFARRWTDETEGVVEDPNQQQLPIEGEAAP